MVIDSGPDSNRIKIILMKYCLSFLLIVVNFCSYSQQQSFDITHFTAPKGWKKQTTGSVLQLSKEDATTGGYCIITISKALPADADSKANFDAAWESVVKKMVTVSAAPEMQSPSEENGWEAQSGYAAFENEGSKGVALLITATGYEKMVTMLVLTNSDAYESEMSAFLESVSLKKPTTTATKQNTSAKKPVQPVSKNDGYAFNTTNFDDGWTSTVQEDWVEVVKENTKILIHYPNKITDAYNPNLMDGLKNAWNVLVAPRYSSAGNFEFKPISGWQSIEFAEADMVEKLTAKSVHVVLFKMNYSNGSGKYIEFITPDKNSFEQQFGAYHPESYGWEKMERMANYNKFAVAATDLQGKWTSDFFGLTQYVNAYTGASAGANSHASNESFEFAAGNTYKWNLGVASGFVGNIKFQSVKSNGKFSMSGNWQINLSDIEGKPKTSAVHFTCIKNARILWIGETGFGRAE